MSLMSDASPQPISIIKPARRWFRFSMRTMIVVVTAFCVWLGITSSRANRQRRAVEIIKKAGGTAYYDFDADDDGVLRTPPLSPSGPDWLRRSIGIDYFSTVVRVGLDDRKNPNDDAFAALADLPQLRNLFLGGSAVSDAVMSRLKGLNQLHALIVVHSTVTDAGWKAFERLTQLKSLRIDGLNFTDSSLVYVMDLSGLRRLFLIDTQVSDFGVTYIIGLSQLEEVALYRSKVSDAGICQLKSLSHLKKLTIEKRKVTSAGVAALKRALPSLTVVGI